MENSQTTPNTNAAPVAPAQAPVQAAPAAGQGVPAGARSYPPRGGAGGAAGGRSFGGGYGGGARGGDSRGPRRDGPGGGRRGPGREPRAKPEFDQKIIGIRRVTRVAAGGRRFSFSVSLVAGDRKGRVGVGIGKASDTSLAIDKAVKNAKKNLVRIPMTKNASIPHQVEAKYASSRVIIFPAKGKGLVAGSSVRNVIELAGLNDITAKILSRSKNPLNNARVAIKALGMLRTKGGSIIPTAPVHAKPAEAAAPAAAPKAMPAAVKPAEKK